MDFTWEPGAETLVPGSNGSGRTSVFDARERVRNWTLGWEHVSTTIRKAEARALLAAGGETHLIVMVDADGGDHASARRQLLNALDGTPRDQVEANERWLLVSPAWELENWVGCLEGRAVTEARDPGLSLDHDKACRAAARALADRCGRGRTRPERVAVAGDGLRGVASVRGAQRALAERERERRGLEGVSEPFPVAGADRTRT